MCTKTFNADNFLSYNTARMYNKRVFFWYQNYLHTRKHANVVNLSIKIAKTCSWNPLKDAIILSIILWIMLYSQKVTQELTFAA